MNRQLALGIIAASAAAAVALPPATGITAPARAPHVVPIAVGDGVQLRGTHVRCLAARLRGNGAVDCFREGELAGTYGTVITPTNVLVVRFKHGRSGTIVFAARQGQKRFTTCATG
jgi:hypothetical protein